MARRRILVGYDGSDGARRALDRAADEARENGAHVTVLVVEDLPLDPEAPRTFGTLADMTELEWEGGPLEAPPDVVAGLDAARKHLAQAGVDCDLRWAAGTPARAIVDAARDVRADVIVVGEHHHSFLGRFFGTDTAEGVRHEAPCDVVVA